MRVAQVIGKLAAAGVEAVVNNYYCSMNTERIQFDYFIDEDSELAPPQEMIDRGARYFVVPSTRHAAARVRALTALFRENHYAIVHAHMNTLNLPVLYAAWRADVPVRISHNHSAAAPEEKARTLLKLMLRPTAGWFATDRMACGEQAAVWMFGKKAVEAGRVTVLPNAIDAAAFAYDAAGRDSLRRQWGFDADMVVIGHVGRFMPQKNHAFLLTCFAQYHKRHANSRLLLVGGGELKEQVQRQAETLGIGGAVCMAGVHKDMRQVYSAMDIFALPSLYEGLPMVCLEAQANGLPCLMSDRVTAETAVTPEAVFLPLDHGPEPWCAAFERADRQKDRAGGVEAVRRAGRDVRQTGIQLERLYEKMTAGGADR